MESLPDELLLSIFQYLHKFDLLYSFNGLNRRFQQIIEPIVQNINLTQENLTYKHFRLFVKHILPSQGSAIRSLTVSGMQSFDLIRSHLHHLSNLESLTLKSPLFDTIGSDKFDCCLIQAVQIPTLNQLSVHVNSSRLLESISKYATPNLQTVKLLHSYDSDYFRGVTRRIRYLRRLSIRSMSTSDLVKLFKIVVNLEELNLSLYSITDMENIQVPNTLEKLQLKIDVRQLKSKHDKKSLHQSNLHMLSKLLHNFRNHLKYVGLIILNADKEFLIFDNFNSLVNDFDHLETFEYDIRTKYRPDEKFPNVEKLISLGSIYSAYTNPRPQSFETSFHIEKFQECALTSELTQSQLFLANTLDAANSDFLDMNLSPSFELSEDLKLINLNTVLISKSTMDTNSEIAVFLSKVIASSPNLRSLILHGNAIQDILLLLKQFIAPKTIFRKISHIQLIVCKRFSNQDLAFFSDLSCIVPNLKSVTLRLDNEFNVGKSDKLKKLIRKLRADFHKLTNLTIKVADDYESEDEGEGDSTSVVMERYRKILEELRHDPGESIYWSTDNGMRGLFIIIWM